jgi:hypothetical protein
MSLLDARPTSAWTTVLIDYGPSRGSKRYGGYAPVMFLDNFAALTYAAKFPITSSLLQWNGTSWQHMIKPRGAFP